MARSASIMPAAQRTARAGPSKSGEEAVARGIDLAPPEALQCLPDDVVMPVEQVAPGPIAELQGAFGRTDDVAEQHGGQHALGLLGFADRGAERPNLANDLPGVRQPRRMVLAFEFDIARTRQQARQFPPAAHVDLLVAARVHDQRRRVHRGQHRTNVDLQVHVVQRHHGGRTGTHAKEAAPPPADRLVLRHAGHDPFDGQRRAPFGLAEAVELLQLLHGAAPGGIGAPGAGGVAA
jgi:hypothetical protein